MNINNPTLASQVGDVSRIPVIMQKHQKHIIDRLTDVCVENTKQEWNSFETAWDFKKHPLVQ